MNSKDKGNIAESLALAEFIKYGITVSVPFGDNCRYDLIAEFNGKLNKIQVKYTSELTDTDSIICMCVSTKNHITNKRLDFYTDIDYFVFYLQPWDMLLLVPEYKVRGKKSICFRKSVTKTNQQKNVNFVQDFTFDKVLNMCL